VTALDISAGMLDAARRRVGAAPDVTWIQDDMLAFLLRRAAGQAALILSTWAIGYSHHRQVLREAGRVLAPGGVLAFIVNYADTLAPVFHAFHRCLARHPTRSGSRYGPISDGLASPAPPARRSRARHPVPHRRLPPRGAAGRSLALRLAACDRRARRVRRRPAAARTRPGDGLHAGRTRRTHRPADASLRTRYSGEDAGREMHHEPADSPLLLMLLDPRITATPLRVLRELRRRGIQRLPDNLHEHLERGIRRPSLVRFARQWLAGERISRTGASGLSSTRSCRRSPGRAYERLFTNLLSGRHLSPVSAFLAVTAACPAAVRTVVRPGPREQSLPPPTGSARSASFTQSASASSVSRAASRSCARTSRGLGTGGDRRRRGHYPVLPPGSGSKPPPANALRHAGLGPACVSLDHPDAAEYDRQRGMPGPVGAGRRGVRLARRTGFYTMLSTVASLAVVRSRTHEKIYGLARELGADEYRLVEPCPAAVSPTRPRRIC